MSKKKINAGDTLTVGDLTDDYIGAEIEVDDGQGVWTRLVLDRIEEAHADAPRLVTSEGGYKAARVSRPARILTPPPVVQPDEPKETGQLVRIEGDPYFFAVVLDQGSPTPFRERGGFWRNWEHIMRYADGRRIIVSDPPRWSDDED